MYTAPLSPYCIAILDDHPSIRTALRFTLQSERDMQLVGEYGRREEMLTALQSVTVDVLVLDYLLADDEIDGLQMVRHLLTRHDKLKILVSTSLESVAVVQLLLKAGVRGFIGKSKEQSELLQAIRRVAQGERYLSEDMRDALEKAHSDDRHKPDEPLTPGSGEALLTMMRDLSPREEEVLRCYLDGLSVTEIAVKFARSRKTVSGQKQAALRKLGLRSDIELFKYKDYFTNKA
ncbi:MULTISPECIES: response regulator transcription factor [Duffyella]|jgi:DNA-binding NarL/FixJ family response regulator|uniref:Response regulator n=1 Tax=Duffyella gerundensis TaxID=1619313 RepID=A0A0U5L3K2_9GAMM|nr:response regulator transcription factor [Duffyella gerundensis]QTO53003.1 response regulator transcription factor [Duffyella gerundensis]CUU23637.1 response regulator [Duffyella gerundensis]